MSLCHESFRVASQIELVLNYQDSVEPVRDTFTAQPDDQTSAK